MHFSKIFTADKLLRKIIVITVYLVSLSLCCPAQQASIDSLKIIANQPGSNSVSALIELSRYAARENDSMAMPYAKQAYKRSKENGDQRYIAEALVQIGELEEGFGDFLTSLNNAIDIFSGIADSVRIADCYALIANRYFYKQFNAAESLNYALKAVSFYEGQQHRKGQAQMLGLIGNAYIEMENEEKAIESLEKAKQICISMNDKVALAYIYNNIGQISAGRKQYSYAFENYSLALQLYQELDSLAPPFGIAYTFGLIGSAQLEVGNSAIAAGNRTEGIKRLDSALYCFNKQYDMESKRNASHRISTVSLARSFLALAKLHPMPKRKELLDKSYQYITQALTIADSENFVPGRTNAYAVLHEIDEWAGNFKDAYEHHKLYTAYKDSLVTQENIESANAYRTQYEYEKKENEIKLLATENELKTTLVQKENQRKNFALAGIGITILIGSYGFYWLRKRKQFQNEQNLTNERLRISRELHDEVGATLSGVAMYSHLTKTQLRSQDITGVENSLTVMQDSSAQMVNKLNDIVWLINPDKSNLPELIRRLEEYARKMADARDMEVKFNISETLHQHQLTMEQRRNIYLFCKEAINNAVKYSQGTLLELYVRDEERLLQFSVRDNGRGFDPATVKRGSGLNNQQQRAKEMGAIYAVESREGNGSIVSLQLKIT